MKLHFVPGVCSLSPHIVLRELGVPFTLVKVDRTTKRTADGRDYWQINPKGYVPALELDDGQVLTEGVAIVQYLADKHPEKKLAPAAGTMERYRFIELLNFVATEVHKGFTPLFNAKAPEEMRQAWHERLATRLDHVAKILAKQPYLAGERFTVVDPYLFTVLRWSARTNVDLSRWPEIVDYMKRIEARPAVREALEAEKAAG